MAEGNGKVTVRFRLIHNSANFIQWQLFYAGIELTPDEDGLYSAQVTRGKYRLLRWYAVSSKSEEPYTIRILVPDKHRLRYPAIPIAKVKKDIEGKMPKTDKFMDHAGWRRFKVEKDPQTSTGAQ